jgi:indolepyruvate ferredoxin oxidoreductase alpha subunit
LRRLLSGIEASAHGALEAGVHLAAACPGPVASEVLDALAARGGVLCERAPSEKVALEVALGASLAGARSMAVLRAGGLDAGASALAAASCANVGGLAILLCDDPGGRVAPSVDSRLAARAALVPVIEPSDPEECHAFLGAALDLSERFETPVAVRLTTRLADFAGPVDTGPARAEPPRGCRQEDPARRSLPGRGGAARARALERLALLAGHGWDTPLNRMELRSPETGIVTSGLAYGMVRELLPEASVLKLGLVYPVPTGLVREFAAYVRRLFVVEELEPFLEAELRAAGIACGGKDRLTRAGELTPASLARAFAPDRPRARPAEPVPERPPELCPGCPHRATFFALKRLHLSVTGDLGCSALAGLPPLAAVDRAHGLGASLGVAHGLEAALGDRIAGRSVAVVGDGALLHSASGALALSARGRRAVVVADNRALPGEGERVGGGGGTGTGAHATGGRRVDLGSLCLALGAESVQVVDPLRPEALADALRREAAGPGPSVVIARSPCVRLRTDRRPPQRVDPVRCNRCGACLRLGCPALSAEPESMAIDRSACAGCGLCSQVCRAKAIGPEVRA